MPERPGAAGDVARGERARAMAGRVVATGRRVGLDTPAAQRIGVIFTSVLQYREIGNFDERHPEFLHPGRTALILMDDVCVVDPATIMAGMALDSQHPGLTPLSSALAAWSAADAAEILDEIPRDATDDAFVEKLLLASARARQAALAERLDHARHLHLGNRAGWPAFHDEVVEVYLPIATRTDATLERRLRRWVAMFGKRYLGR